MSIKCPKCGQPLKEEKDKEYVECFICKTRVELPKQQIPTAQPVQQPQQPQSQKPTHGFCVQCRGTNLTFNDDGTGKCNNCGRVFNWKQQQPQPSPPNPYPQPPPMPSPPIYQPRCFKCSNPNLQYFPDGRAICTYCQQKYRWSYDYYGRIILREMDFFDDLH